MTRRSEALCYERGVYSKTTLIASNACSHEIVTSDISLSKLSASLDSLVVSLHGRAGVHLIPYRLKRRIIVYLASPFR